MTCDNVHRYELSELLVSNYSDLKAPVLLNERSTDDDLLDRGYVVDALLDAINFSMNPEYSNCIGLEGEWGAENQQKCPRK